MLKHYLKHAIKNFRSNKLISAGSIITVFLGALCISLLFSYIRHELSMDDFNKRENDIYLVTHKASPASNPEAWDANLFFQLNYEEFPGVEKFTNVKKYKEGEIKFDYGATSFSPAGIVADSCFLDIFDFALDEGDRTTVMRDPDAIIFSRDMAGKIFGREDPMGKTVTVTTNRQKTYTVKGILQPIPSNSSMTFDFIIPDHSMRYSRMGGNFILANNSFNEAAFSEKINNAGKSVPRYEDGITEIFPLGKMYFEGSNIDTIGIFSKFGDKKSLSILYAIIVVVFIISLLNFTNLQIININSSIKNIGINKITGAGTGHIFLQKISEILFLIFISAVLITLTFNIVLPYFNQIARVNLSPELWYIFTLNVVILVVMITGAMIYPAIVYFLVPVTSSLKNQIFAPTKLAGKRVLVTTQFALSFVLLVASIVVTKQLNLMLSKDLGFQSENIISTQLFHEPYFTGTFDEQMVQYEAFMSNQQHVYNELMSASFIKNFSRGQSPVQPLEMAWKLENGEDDFTTKKMIIATPEYAEILDLNILEGRFFDRNIDEERSKKVVINEAAKKYWGITDISSQQVRSESWGNYDIIGVVKDFNFEHLSVQPRPLVILFMENFDDNFLIRFEEGATQAGLQFVQQLYKDNNPGEIFTYSFLSDDIEALYQKEKRLSEIYILFAIIAYVISAIGLLIISLYDTLRRIKEIGVRKVNGAKVSEILAMLNKDFVKWVVIAFIIATPIAYYAMNRWLENFAYRTNLSWWIFALAGLLALGIALLTVSWQSWRAATRNPVEALRYE